MSSLHLSKRVLSYFIRCEMLFTPPVASRGGVGPDPSFPPSAFSRRLRAAFARLRAPSRLRHSSRRLRGAFARLRRRADGRKGLTKLLRVFEEARSTVYSSVSELSYSTSLLTDETDWCSHPFSRVSFGVTD